jgi:hypothetical protein
VIDVLKAAFVQGRLTKDEFDLRVGQAFAARTYAELADVTADIPAGLIGAQPRRPARARAGKAAGWGAFGIILPALLAVAIVPGPTTTRAVITTTVVIYLLCWACGVCMMLASRPSKRSAHRPENLPILPGRSATVDRRVRHERIPLDRRHRPGQGFGNPSENTIQQGIAAISDLLRAPRARSPRSQSASAAAGQLRR